MAKPPPLTTGALQQIMDGQPVRRPVLQILAYKKVPSDGKSQEHFRFIMSDGQTSHPCCIMIGDHLVPRVEEGDFKCNTILRLEEYTLKDIRGIKVRISSMCKLYLTDG